MSHVIQRFLEGMLDVLYPPRCMACDSPVEPYRASSLAFAPAPTRVLAVPLACALAPASTPSLAETPAAEEQNPEYATGFGFCSACSTSLYPVGQACTVCAEPANAPISVTCSRCRRSAPAFRRVHVSWRYGGELAVALRRLKYGGPGRSGRLELARPLGMLLAPALDRAIAEAKIDLIVPVPLHPRRLRQRGFSQALAIVTAARRVSSITSLPRIDSGLLVRVRPTAEQACLGRTARERNVQGAFAVTKAGSRRLLGKRVLLVDDVLTTGATAGACARSLLVGGAYSVDVLALARAEN
ncbi:MAG: ComF family protein [Pseudomonadota bacterium]